MLCKHHCQHDNHNQQCSNYNCEHAHCNYERLLLLLLLLLLLRRLCLCIVHV